MSTPEPDGTRRMPAPLTPPCGSWEMHGAALRDHGTCLECDDMLRRSRAGERFGLDPAPLCRLCQHPAGPGGVLCPTCLAYSDSMGGVVGSGPSVPATVERLIQLAAARLAESPTESRRLAILRALASGAGAIHARGVLDIVREAILGITGEPGAPLAAALADLSGPDVPPPCGEAYSHAQAMADHGTCSACMEVTGPQAEPAAPPRPRWLQGALDQLGLDPDPHCATPPGLADGDHGDEQPDPLEGDDADVPAELEGRLDAALGPLPQRHPREVIVERAAQRLRSLLIDVELTPPEEMRLLADAMRSLAQSCVVVERAKPDIEISLDTAEARAALEKLVGKREA